MPSAGQGRRTSIAKSGPADREDRPTKELLYDALVKRADKIMLDYTRDAVAGQYMIDGNGTTSRCGTGPQGTACWPC